MALWGHTSGSESKPNWLSDADSQRLIQSEGYDVAADAQLAVMVISDRLSAFECMWRAEGGLDGVPGKGAALNGIQIAERLLKPAAG